MAAALPFTDVTESDWFYNDVKTAYESGIINGKSATSYAPSDNMTYGEAIKLAACMNMLAVDGDVKLLTAKTGEKWYMPYVNYCKDKLITDKDYSYDSKATRAGYMTIFAKCLPSEMLPEINYIADGAIPDVPASASYADSVYKLYRAGIVTGVDDAHNCNPNANIKRSEVAAIITRMNDASARQKFTMGEKPKEDEKKEDNKKDDIVVTDDTVVKTDAGKKVELAIGERMFFKASVESKSYGSDGWSYIWQWTPYGEENWRNFEDQDGRAETEAIFNQPIHYSIRVWAYKEVNGKYTEYYSEPFELIVK